MNNSKNEYYKEWRKKNRDKIREYKKEYYKNHSGSLVNLKNKYNLLEDKYISLLKDYNKLKEIVIKENLDRGINIDVINTIYNFK